MRHGKQIIILTVTALMLLSVCAPALAAVTDVTRQDNGMVSITWDDQEAAYLCILPKMSDSRGDDSDHYPLVAFQLDEGKRELTNYSFAPGQDYWVYTLDSAYMFKGVYVYEAPAVENFNEFKSRPSMSDLVLKKEKNGNTVKVSSFSVQEIEQDWENTDFIISLQYSYPQLKTARTYFGQYVLTSPDQDSFVLSAFWEELPVGHTYYQLEKLALNGYFRRLVKLDKPIPTGKYTFSLYWDGKFVDSVTFTVN